MADEANSSEREYWNSGPAEPWVRFQDDLDAMMAPVRDRVIHHARPAPGERVVDIGCGTGDTTFAAAEAAGASGDTLGLDISERLLARARERAGDRRVRFLAADAQTHDFGEPFDVALSRFGVMFFDDPVAAFANIGKGVRAGGRLAVAAWAPMDANPWFSKPRDVAAARLGRPEPPDPHAPGPFAFADGARVLSILADAGWAEGALHVEEVGLTHPGGLDAVAAMATSLGPATRILKMFEGGPDDEAAIQEGVRDVFRPYVTAGVLTIPATINVFTAGRPA